ncbi:MAG: SHOCT domain-containing protein [Candidatus Binatia bacterium]
MMDGMGMMVWGFFSFLLGLLILFLFVLAVAYVKWVWGQRPEGMTGREESALDILKRRYAKGEINKEEFERVKREIE